MSTEQRLQTCVALMAALATLMLGTSQDSTMLPVIALVVAATSLIFTDFLGWFYLHRFVAGVAALIAGVNAFMQSQTGGVEAQFLSVANLLIHMQIILLFQRKETRIYWQLMTLSLLQVVVAAALNLFVAFGPLLVLYTGIAILAMLLFFSYRRQQEFETGKTVDAENRSGNIQVETVHRMAHTATRDARVGRKMDQPRTGYLRHLVLLAISTVLMSAGVFLLMPRFGNESWKANTSRTKTGYSGERMSLDQVGSLYESPTIVMRVSFVDIRSNQQYQVSGYPYFRGGVLDVYQRGEWYRQHADELKEQTIMRRLRAPQRIYSAVRQNVHLESSRVSTVFTVAPPCALNDTSPAMRISRRTQEVRYFPGDDDDKVEYSIGTLGFRNGQQSDYIPNIVPSSGDGVGEDDFESVRRHLPALTAKAAEIVKDIPEDDVISRANKLESYFTNGQAGFQYSLRPSPKRDRAAPDPVEDFVLNHKTGHCQFFASALALMLRSQGIPSRIVQGYRADSYNVVGGYYQLREMDAHAWVEAAIPGDQVPSDEILPMEGISGGAWLRLDPTPGDNYVSQRVAVSPWRQKMADTMDYMQLLWSEYVLGLNEKRQRKAIYDPIMNAFRNAREQIFSREVWSARWKAVRERMQGDFFTRENVRDSVIAIAVLTVAFYVLRFFLRMLWNFVAGQWRGSKRRRGPKIEFYRRFESILAKHGFRRSAQQTQHEFATVVGKQLRGTHEDEAIAEIPQNVVDLFYRVRFGSDRLDTQDAKRLENWLGTLQQALSK